MTTTEAENAFALSVVESGELNAALIAREKARAVKKNGLLEIIGTKETLEDIGGLDMLKDWLLKRKEAFSPRARSYGLPMPKGLLILGIPGTGKSLTAKATSAVLGVPLLKLDAGRIFAGLVGQSESNLRSVIQTAEAIAPVVLWIDELEKGFSGSRSSGATDGGTSSRVFGSFISWMQEKTAPVFVVATSNDVSQLPPEMLRKGRFDELFFVDLPNREEREIIWNIQVAKHGRDTRQFDLAQLSKSTDGLTGGRAQPRLERVHRRPRSTGTGQTMEPVARRYGCSLSTISSLKRRLSVELQESFGADILMEVARRPEWQSSIRVERERVACRVDRRHR